MSAKEKIAWLKGLLSGLELEGRDAKIYGAVSEALDALATQIEEQNEQIASLRGLYDELEEECAALNDDIMELEDIVNEDYDDDDDDDNDDGSGDYPASYVSVECPECGVVFYYGQGENGEDGKVECPECGEKFSVELSDLIIRESDEEADD